MASPSPPDVFSRMEYAIVRLVLLGLLLTGGHKVLRNEVSTVNHPTLVSALGPAQPAESGASR